MSTAGTAPDQPPPLAQNGTGLGSHNSHGRQHPGKDGPGKDGPGKDGLVDSLRRQIRHLETALRCDAGGVSSTGCQALDRLLPEGGLATGTITEWLAPHAGSGAEMLSLVAAREASCTAARTTGQTNGALVIADSGRHFYPPAAAAWGIDLDNTIVLRSQNRQELYWAVDQSLRCPAVAAVWGWLDHVDARWQRRFQLSAEESGARGMFIRPTHVRGQPSWCDVQWGIIATVRGQETRAQRGHATVRGQETRAQRGRTQRGREIEPSFARRVHLQLLRCRGGTPGGQVTIEIDFTTGGLQDIIDAPRVTQPDEKYSLHLAAQLAHPAARRRSARA